MPRRSRPITPIEGTFESPAHGVVTGRAAIADVYRYWFTAFPDLQITWDEALIDGDRAAVFWRFAGTSRGPFFGVVGAGSRVELRGAAEYRVCRRRHPERAAHLRLLQHAGEDRRVEGEAGDVKIAPLDELGVPRSIGRGAVARALLWQRECSRTQEYCRRITHSLFWNQTPHSEKVFGIATSMSCGSYSSSTVDGRPEVPVRVRAAGGMIAWKSSSGVAIG